MLLFDACPSLTLRTTPQVFLYDGPANEGPALQWWDKTVREGFAREGCNVSARQQPHQFQTTTASHQASRISQM